MVFHQTGEVAGGSLVLVALNGHQDQSLESHSGLRAQLEELQRVAVDARQVEYLHAHRDQVRERLFRLRVERQQALIKGFCIVEAAQELKSYGFAEQGLLLGGIRPAQVEAGQSFLEALQAQEGIAARDANRVAVWIERGLLLNRSNNMIEDRHEAAVAPVLSLRGTARLRLFSIVSMCLDLDFGGGLLVVDGQPSVLPLPSGTLGLALDL